MNGPSASWYVVTGAGILFGIAVLFFSGLYWTLLLLPLAGFSALEGATSTRSVE
jgi:hypothetical protein